MGLLDKLRNNTPAAPATPGTSSPPIAPASPEAVVPTRTPVDPLAERRAKMQAEIAQLEAEEAAAAQAKARAAEEAAQAATAAAEAAQRRVVPADAPESGTTAPKGDPVSPEQLAALPAPVQAAVVAAQAGAPPEAANEPPAGKRGRPKGSKNSTSAAAPAADGPLWLFADCPIVNGIDGQDLDTFISEALSLLATKNGVPDVRFAPNDSPLSFGKWEGAFVAIVKANADTLKGLWYVNNVRESKPRQLAVEALHLLAAVYVRGGC